MGTGKQVLALKCAFGKCNVVRSFKRCNPAFHGLCSRIIASYAFVCLDVLSLKRTFWHAQASSALCILSQSTDPIYNGLLALKNCRLTASKWVKMTKQPARAIRRKEPEVVGRGSCSDQRNAGETHWKAVWTLAAFSGMFTFLWTLSRGWMSLLSVTQSSSQQSWICPPVTVITPVCAAFSASRSLSVRPSQELTPQSQTNCFIWAFCLRGQKLSLLVGQRERIINRKG